MPARLEHTSSAAGGGSRCGDFAAVRLTGAGLVRFRRLSGFRLGHARLRIVRQVLGLDTRPILSAAEEAQEASLHAQRGRIEQSDIGRISVAVFGIIDLPVPSIGLARRHAEQDWHSQGRTRPQIGVGIFAVDPGGRFPAHHPPHLAVAVGDLDAGELLVHQPFAGWIGLWRLLRQGDTREQPGCREGNQP